MNDPWRVVFARSAAAQLSRLPPAQAVRVADRIADLAINQLPPGSRRVVGTSYWRIRVGDARVVYSLDQATRTVVVVRVARRAESTYRRLRR